MNKTISEKYPFPWSLNEFENCIQDAKGNLLIEDNDTKLLEFIINSVNLNKEFADELLYR